ncbi:MAG: LPS export ABC transporter periplasmic protein LptC [Geobacter sp.]|nr:MAG: LPS export ABC transporter periplasmic protein LptC [Geobacter sp.]
MLSLGNIRFVLAILVTTAIIGIVVTISLKGSKQAQLESVHLQLPQNIDVALHNARFTEMRDGTPVWELVAEKAEYSKSGDLVFLDGIRMEFANSGSAGNINVEASKGEYSTKTRDVKLRGAVHMTTGSGARFKTESIDYLAAKSEFRTAEQVEFQQQRLTLVATGMELDVKDQKAKFLKSIDATVAAAKKR